MTAIRLVLLSATVGQFFNLAHASVLPELASEEDLMTRMTERMMRMNMIDVARPSHFDQ